MSHRLHHGGEVVPHVIDEDVKVLDHEDEPDNEEDEKGRDVDDEDEQCNARRLLNTGDRNERKESQQKNLPGVSTPPRRIRRTVHKMMGMSTTFEKYMTLSVPDTTAVATYDRIVNTAASEATNLEVVFSRTL